MRLGALILPLLLLAFPAPGAAAQGGPCPSQLEAKDAQPGHGHVAPNGTFRANLTYRIQRTVTCRTLVTCQSNTAVFQVEKAPKYAVASMEPSSVPLSSTPEEDLAKSEFRVRFNASPPIGATDEYVVQASACGAAIARRTFHINVVDPNPQSGSSSEGGNGSSRTAGNSSLAGRFEGTSTVPGLEPIAVASAVLVLALVRRRRP